MLCQSQHSVTKSCTRVTRARVWHTLLQNVSCRQAYHATRYCCCVTLSLYLYAWDASHVISCNEHPTRDIAGLSDRRYARALSRGFFINPVNIFENNVTRVSLTWFYAVICASGNFVIRLCGCETACASAFFNDLFLERVAHTSWKESSPVYHLSVRNMLKVSFTTLCMM